MNEVEKNLLRKIERSAFWSGVGVGIIVGGFACFVLAIVHHWL